jgi:predicted AlkP superfamily phosphohydrolase/phosphomutase
LQRLLALYASTPNVLIVSDHGHGAATIVTSWRGWHTKEGILLAAGPSVPQRDERIDISYYDILPTIAWLKGFRSQSSAGRSVLP